MSMLAGNILIVGKRLKCTSQGYEKITWKLTTQAGKPRVLKC